MASPELDVVIGMLRSASPLAGGTLLEKRGRMELQTTLTPRPGDVRFEPVSAGGVPAEWTAAPGARSDRALVYLHGGLGDVTTLDAGERQVGLQDGRRIEREVRLGRLDALRLVDPHVEAIRHRQQEELRGWQDPMSGEIPSHGGGPIRGGPELALHLDQHERAAVLIVDFEICAVAHERGGWTRG